MPIKIISDEEQAKNGTDAGNNFVEILNNSPASQKALETLRETCGNEHSIIKSLQQRNKKKIEYAQAHPEIYEKKDVYVSTDKGLEQRIHNECEIASKAIKNYDLKAREEKAKRAVQSYKNEAPETACEAGMTAIYKVTNKGNTPNAEDIKALCNKQYSRR